MHLGEADLIVGTSAGAIVGAVIASGQNPARLATVRRSANAASAPHRPDPAVTGAVFAVLGDPGLDLPPPVARWAASPWNRSTRRRRTS
ncbi:patatin-like phospholipase family protein [Streptomyces sp. SID161]|uniref:patatin-like phospholipase family protein n=1 Tax=Streptomyces sp. SID161 TaxID=2690251 RepID=UPI0031FED8FE